MTLGLLFVAGFVSWLVSTIGAGGGAMLLVPLVGFLLGAQAVAPVVTLSTIISGGRLWVFRDAIEWRIVAWALPGALAGAALGAWAFTQAPVTWLQIALGLLLLSAPLQYRFGRRKQTFSVRRWYFLPAQTAVGAVSGLLGAVGPVLNILYLNAGIAKERIVGTKTLVSTPMHLVKLGTYAAFGVLSGELLLFGAAAGAGALLSNTVGRRMLDKLSGERFRQIVTGLMALSGAAMIWQAAT